MFGEFYDNSEVHNGNSIPQCVLAPFRASFSVIKTCQRLEVKYATCYIMVLTLLEAKILYLSVKFERTDRTDGPLVVIFSDY